jgi:3-dehydroquinate synthase
VRTVPVKLADRSYDIRIGLGLLDRLAKDCLKLGLGKRVAIITDQNVGALYANRVQKEFHRHGFEPCVVTVQAGERAKRLETVRDCYNQLARHRLERKSFVLALGGGVVGDLAGFVAATYLRGVPFVQAPTTLLAQVDSSVGGKVGVNLPAGKNLVGAFYQPKLVACDLGTLKSLPAREFRAGLAEIIKYGIIYDRQFFLRLERDADKLLGQNLSTLAAVVARCCEIKAEVVGQDETETGLRAILNFGHTIGHALEAISHYGKFLHGEAISIGQVAAARLSTTLHGLTTADANRIEELFRRVGLPTTVSLTRDQRSELLDAMRLDKKVSAGEVKFVLARSIGQVDFGVRVPEPRLHQVLDSLGAKPTHPRSSLSHHRLKGKPDRVTSRASRLLPRTKTPHPHVSR